MVKAFAPAKINLTLHVTGQRDDGYHLLDSLVVFADVGDEIAVEAADDLSLTIDGPFVADLSSDADNLVLQAARFLNPARGAEIILTKNLPVASGIGGGSADAAATLRALAELWELPLPDDVMALGADVPTCLAARVCRMSGVGEVRQDVPSLPGMDILLVNPGVSVSTPAVFEALKSKNNPGMGDLPGWADAGEFCDWLSGQRNDLRNPATTLVPEIGVALDLIRETDCLFAAMSGSGATCFGLFEPGDAARKAAAQIEAQKPGWWVAAGSLLQ